MLFKYSCDIKISKVSQISSRFWSAQCQSNEKKVKMGHKISAIVKKAHRKNRRF